MQERSQRLETLIDLTCADRKQRLTYAANLATQFSKASEEVEEILALWVKWWHDLLLLKNGDDKFITNVDKKSALSQQVKNYSLRQIVNFIRCLQATSEQLGQNANPRLALEVLMLNMP